MKQFRVRRLGIKGALFCVFGLAFLLSVCAFEGLMDSVGFFWAAAILVLTGTGAAVATR